MPGSQAHAVETVHRAILLQECARESSELSRGALRSHVEAMKRHITRRRRLWEHALESLQELCLAEGSTTSRLRQRNLAAEDVLRLLKSRAQLRLRLEALAKRAPVGAAPSRGGGVAHFRSK